jgi:hypothetical protein
MPALALLQRESNYTAGVDPVWTMPGAPVSFTWLSQAERESKVCFKCHASFTSLPTYLPDGWDGSDYVPDSQDMAQEFNPYNASFHPVVATGRNQNMPPGSLVPGWSASSLVYCTDCHTNAKAPTEGDGPHGSPLLHSSTDRPITRRPIPMTLPTRGTSSASPATMKRTISGTAPTPTFIGATGTSTASTATTARATCATIPTAANSST